MEEEKRKYINFYMSLGKAFLKVIGESVAKEEIKSCFPLLRVL